MKIIAFGASHSATSINKQFAHYVANLFKDSEVTLLDLNNYPLPIFTVDIEKAHGYPPQVNQFIADVENADLFVISMAEHNGNMTAGFKNLFDWVSRVNAKIFNDKAVLLLSTSPGGRGGIGSLEAAKARFPYHGANIVNSFSLPEFYTNFDVEKQIVTNEEFSKKLLLIVDEISNS